MVYTQTLGVIMFLLCLTFWSSRFLLCLSICSHFHFHSFNDLVYPRFDHDKGCVGVLGEWCALMVYDLCRHDA